MRMPPRWQYAFAGSKTFADTYGPVVGAIVLGLIFQFILRKEGRVPESMLGTAAFLIACSLATWLLFIGLRWVYAPVHFAGGWFSFWQKTLGGKVSPLALIGLGLLGTAISLTALIVGIVLALAPHNSGQGSEVATLAVSVTELGNRVSQQTGVIAKFAESMNGISDEVRANSRLRWLELQRERFTQIKNGNEEMWQRIEKGVSTLTNDAVASPEWKRFAPKWQMHIGAIREIAQETFPDERYDFDATPRYSQNQMIKVPHDELITSDEDRQVYRRLYDQHANVRALAQRIDESLGREIGNTQNRISQYARKK